MTDWTTSSLAARATRIAREGKRHLGKFLREAWKANRRMVCLTPEHPPLGNVLLGYIVQGFFHGEDSDLCRSHTHFWESMQIARTWRNLGYRVDVFGNYDYRFTPSRPYDVFVGARMILEPISKQLPPDCLKILHIDTAHWLYHREAQYRRLRAIQRRRGVCLLPRKTLEPNHAIEYADCATMLGNDFTESTYAFAEKTIHRIPISTVTSFPSPSNKDFESCRANFMWLGGTALAHKGLDLVLEAFAEMPEYHLTICGPVEGEEDDFVSAYWEELFETDNIETVGWVDVNSPEFRQIANRTLGLVYPSCSEGQSGGVVLCMHAGLIPVVSVQSGVDVSSDFGVILRESSIEEIKTAVRSVGSAPRERLESMATGAWAFARRHHTRGQFATVYDRAAREITAAHDLPMLDGELQLSTPLRPRPNNRRQQLQRTSISVQ